jgi:hypothetical protein
LRFGGYGTVTHGTDAVTNENAHGGIENLLSALFASLSARLAALILNTLCDCRGKASGSLLSDRTIHDRFSSFGQCVGRVYSIATYYPCGSEFIRDAKVQPTEIHRLKYFRE